MYQVDFLEGAQAGINGYFWEENNGETVRLTMPFIPVCIIMNIHHFFLLKATLKAKKFQK